MTLKVVKEHSIESYEHFIFFRNLQSLKAAIYGENEEKYLWEVREVRALGERVPADLCPTKNHFSPFGVQRKTYTSKRSEFLS